MRYIVASVNSGGTSLTPDEIRAAAETHRELGAEYQSAVIDSFLDKVSREIDARVDARLAMYQGRGGRPPAARSGRGAVLALAIVSMVFGIPLSAIALDVGHSAGLMALLVVWLGITAINVTFSMHSRPAPGPRPGGR